MREGFCQNCFDSYNALTQEILMKLIVEIKKISDNKISQIHFPSINKYCSIPDVEFPNLETYLKTNIYNQIIRDRTLLRKLLSFKNEDYSEKNTLFVIFEIEAEKDLGLLPTFMPWVGRSMLFLTFIVASVNSFLATVSQGDENNANTALGIVGVVINLIILPLLYKYSRAEAMYRSAGLMIEDNCSKIKEYLCVTETELDINDNAMLPILEDCAHQGLDNTKACTIKNATTHTLFGFVYLTAVVLFVIQYIEYSNGIKSLNDNAARHNAPSLPPSIMPFLSIAVGVIAALNKTAVEGSFLYRGAEYVRDRLFLENKKTKPDNALPLLTIENADLVYLEPEFTAMYKGY
jgi:hypothetical protein